MEHLAFEALLIAGLFQGELTPPLSPVSAQVIKSDSTPPPKTHRVRFKSSRKKEILAKSNMMGSNRTFKLKFWCRALTFILRVNFLSTLNPAHTLVNAVEKITEKWLQAGLITPPPSVLQSAQSPAGTQPREIILDLTSRPSPGCTASYRMCRLVSAAAPGLCTGDAHPSFTTPTHIRIHTRVLFGRVKALMRDLDRLF